jgi:hypothetical protein
MNVYRSERERGNEYKSYGKKWVWQLLIHHKAEHILGLNEKDVLAQPHSRP